MANDCIPSVITWLVDKTHKYAGLETVYIFLVTRQLIGWAGTINNLLQIIRRGPALRPLRAGEPPCRCVEPFTELRQGVGALIRQAGLRVMELLMEEEVRERVGERTAAGSHGLTDGARSGASAWWNPSAARSLGEGLEETLTVHRLHVPPRLRKTLASTNVTESAFSIVERVCANVKRWHAGDQRERWVGSGLLVAEKQFRRVQGHKQIPILLRELEALVPAKSEVVKRRKAS